MDTIFTDIKCMDEERHIRYTGVSNRPILENIRAYAGLSARIVIRVPVIKGVNADEENIRETSPLCPPASARGPDGASALPYPWEEQISGPFPDALSGLLPDAG